MAKVKGTISKDEVTGEVSVDWVKGTISYQKPSGIVVLNPIIRPPAYCDEYLAYYQAMTTKPDDEIASNQNIFVLTMVNNSIWIKWDIGYMFAQQYNTDGEAQINMLNPGTYDSVAYNSPVFTSLEGFTGDAATAYLDTEFDPSIHAVKGSLNSFSITIYSRTDANAHYREGGVTGDNNSITSVYMKYTNIRSYINGTARLQDGVPSDSLGMYTWNRPDGSNIYHWKEAVQLGSGAKAAVSIPDASWYFLANNYKDIAIQNPTARQLSCGFLGEHLTNSEIALVKSAFHTYMDSNSKAVT